ncbi:MAG TPA: alpha-L-fucosidase [Candidatus Binataceae bacterium]|nr:alpha-L-fucosidase [Candidatus Binataceae bacterium]
MEQWFEAARLGMFIHWAPCSQRGWELSWPLVGGVVALPDSQNVAVAEYHSTARSFNPAGFDPQAWAHLARRAGMRYAVLVAKHHDGFAMFHTRESAYSIEHTPFKRDIVGEYADAFRAEGLRVGLYFSLIDWHHPDYPAFTDADKPYRLGQHRRSTPEQWERFTRFMFAQVRELLTNYGRIDLLWFDGGWERMPEEWKSRELEKMIRDLQPGIVINDRLPGCGDYETPEQAVPTTLPARAWETCMTMNNSWGYNPADRNYKSALSLVHTACEVAGKGGNLLLNVSPRGDGSLPPEQVERLEAIASWMERNGECIAGTRPGLEPWQFYGPSTRRDNRVYLHLLMRPYESVSVRGVRVNRVKSATALGAGAKLAIHRRISAADMLFNADPTGELIIDVPASAIDPIATVIALDFEPQE